MISITCHDQKFHSDEVLAIALLKIFIIKDEEIEIFRTRDLETIQKSNIVVDVGGEYNPEFKRFDHHHFDKDSELYGKSSAGLVWDYIKSVKNFEKPYATIDNLVHDVDDQDTGIKLHGHFHFCNIISSFNLADLKSEEQDLAFLDAVDFVVNYLNRIIEKSNAYDKQVKLAKTIEVKTLANVRIAIIPREYDYLGSLFFVGNADIVINYDKFEELWVVSTVPLNVGKFGSKVKLLPAEDSNEVFTHKAGFIGKYTEKADSTIYFSLDTDEGITALSIKMS